MKPIISLAFCFLAFHSFGQTITRYFDSSWNPVLKDEAIYQTDFVWQNNVYQCTSHWISSGKLYATSTYLDTNFSKESAFKKDILNQDNYLILLFLTIRAGIKQLMFLLKKEKEISCFLR